MENLEIKLILSQLEKQDEDISRIKDDISKMIQNNNSSDIANLNKSTLKAVHQIFNQHKDILKNIMALNEMLDKVKSYFKAFLSMMPIKSTQEFTFKGSIKWEIYLYSAFIGFIITFSLISYHNYRDTTNYEKAWKYLLEQDLNDNQKKYFNSILENN